MPKKEEKGGYGSGKKVPDLTSGGAAKMFNAHRQTTKKGLRILDGSTKLPSRLQTTPAGKKNASSEQNPRSGCRAGGSGWRPAAGVVWRELHSRQGGSGNSRSAYEPSQCHNEEYAKI